MTVASKNNIKNEKNSKGKGSNTAATRTDKEIQDKFKVCYERMNDGLIERSEEIKICLTSLIAGEHPLLIGPPGTAKSLLIDSLMKWISSGKKFSALMGKFTTPEELFGTVDLVKLTHDRIYTRNTTGQLPEADLAFLDEIFLSSSAVLNTLLKVLNERTWRNTCGTEIKVPLLMCLAAGNHFPSAQELGALYDRFLFRKKVKPIESVAGRQKLLFSGSSHGVEFEPDEQITRDEIISARKVSRKLPWTDSARIGFLEIWKQINIAGIRIGDRRMFKTKNAIQAFAFMNGRSQVELKDLTISQHSLWEDPQEQPEKVAKIIRSIADPNNGMVDEFRNALNDLRTKVKTGDPSAGFDSYKKSEALKRSLEKFIRESEDDDVIKECKLILQEVDPLVKEYAGKFM